MARWSSASLVKLGGTDRNVIIDEILYGESAFWDVQFNAPTNNKVTSVNLSQRQITVSGDVEIYAVGDTISFTCDATLYQVEQVSGSVLTLNQSPSHEIAGQFVQLPIDVTDADIEFKLTPRTAVVEDGRNGLDIIRIDPIEAAGEVVGAVSTTVPSQDPLRGEVRLILAAADIVDSITPLPDLEANEVIMLTGYFSLTRVEDDLSTPVQTKKQRFCVVVRTDGIVI